MGQPTKFSHYKRGGMSGFTVRYARDLDEALRILRAEKPRKPRQVRQVKMPTFNLPHMR